MTSLTVWSFTKTAWSRAGMCRVDAARAVITCDGHASFTSPVSALANGQGEYVTRFPCRVLGRDDQGVTMCIPGKPTLGFDATKGLRRFALDEALAVTHLWAAPPVVKRYLRTGAPKLRTIARDAATVALRDAGAASTWSAIRATILAAGRIRDSGAAWDVASFAARAEAYMYALEGKAWSKALNSARERQSRRLTRLLSPPVVDRRSAPGP